MTRSYPKSSQIANDDALETLGVSAETPLDTLFSKLAQEVEFPYRLHAAATPTSFLYITGSSQSMATGAKEVWSIGHRSIDAFASGYVDFQARAYSASVTISFPSSTVGYYRLCVFSIMPDGSVQATFTDENAALGSLADPLFVLPVNHTLIGWVQLECTDVAGSFKTAGSSTDVIENSVGGNSRIYHYIDKSTLRLKVSSSSNPLVTDDAYRVGTVWADQTSKRSFLLLNNASGAADWREFVYNGGNESALTLGTNTSAALTFETVNIEAGSISTSQIWTIGPVAGGVTHVIRGALSVDTIYEKTAAAGVTIDSVLLKDGSAQNAEFYGSEPGAISSSTSGQAGTAVTASRSDHNHDLGAHTHTDSTSGGLIVAASATQQGSVTTTTQTFAGVKTFSSNPVFSAMATAGIVHNAADGSTSTSLIVNADVHASAAIDGSKIVSATALVPGVVTTGDQTFAGSKTFSNNVIITGDLTVNGDTTTVNTSTLLVEDNQIVVNNGEVGAGVTAGKAGLLVERGSATDYEFVFQESDDTFRIGLVGSTQAVATREDSPTSSGLPYWNATASRFDTTSSVTWDSANSRLHVPDLRLSSVSPTVEFGGTTTYLRWASSNLTFRVGSDDFFQIDTVGNNMYLGKSNAYGDCVVRMGTLAVKGNSLTDPDIHLSKYNSTDKFMWSTNFAGGFCVFTSSIGGDYTEHIKIPSSGNIEIGSTGNLVHKIRGTGALALPSGTTTNRDALTPVTGNIRWSTTGSVIEYYTGSAWKNVASEAYASGLAIAYSIVFG